MGIFSNMLRPQAAWSPTDERWYSPGGSFYGGWMPTAAGVSVNSESAMRMMTVYNCVKVLYNCVSQMPFHVMQEVDGVKSKAKDDYRFRLLGKRPNSWMTASELWGLAVVHVALRGNFYAFKVGITGRKIQMIVPIDPDKVEKVEQNKDFSLTYHIRNGEGVLEPHPQSRILHIRGMATKGLIGLNPIEYARESIGLGLASEKFLSRYFGRGVHPSAVVKHPQVLNAQTHSNMRAVLKEKYEGLNSESNQGFMFLDEGMDVVFPPIKLVDAQFLELGRFNEAQICGMFGVPLILVQAGDTPATFASSSQFKQSFVDFTIAPLAVNFESAADRDCFSDEEQDRFYCKFNLGSLLRGNMAERFAAYAVAIDKEFMSPNQVRLLEDWNGYGPQGDEFRTRTSTIRQSGSGEKPEPDTEEDNEK